MYARVVMLLKPTSLCILIINPTLINILLLRETQLENEKGQEVEKEKEYIYTIM